MKILAVERKLPGATIDDFKQYGKAEAKRAWELYQQGIIREMYFDRDRHVAVLILECESLDAARETLATLPLVEHGLITFDLTALVPYDGFARLFADGSVSGNHS